VKGKDREWTIPADSVLVALGRCPNDELVASWRGVAPAVIAVGDCANPDAIRNAVHTAARAALGL
jgi:hypothetical protein